MRIRKRGIGILLALFVLGGCVTVPTGPSVMVLPPAGKPFDEFRAEDATCRQWASQSIGVSPQQTINQNTLSGAVVGTAIGAALGAAIGAASASSGAGAAIGAASGLLVGTAAGSSQGQYYGADAQRRYDIAYQQCMYANGNIIPGVRYIRPARRLPPPPPPSGMSAPPENLAPSMPSPPPPAP
jgi:YMGG-like Gly-zipper